MTAINHATFLFVYQNFSNRGQLNKESKQFDPNCIICFIKKTFPEKMKQRN